MKFKELKAVLPKYERNYKGYKIGDVKTSIVSVEFGSSTPKELIGYTINDPRLNDYKVIALYPSTTSSRCYARGSLLIILE